MSNNNRSKFIFSFDFPSICIWIDFCCIFIIFLLSSNFQPYENFAKLSLHIHAIPWKLYFFQKTSLYLTKTFSTSFTGAWNKHTSIVEIWNVRFHWKCFTFRKRDPKILCSDDMFNHCELRGVRKKISILN